GILSNSLAFSSNTFTALEFALSFEFFLAFLICSRPYLRFLLCASLYSSSKVFRNHLFLTSISAVILILHLN
ncbi:hypothetical protein VIGAN_02129700, partial [Vigna angularis var. angularis]